MKDLLTKVDDLIASIVIPLVVEEAREILNKGKVKRKAASYFPLLSRLRYHNKGFEVSMSVVNKCLPALGFHGIHCRFSDDWDRLAYANNCFPYTPATPITTNDYNVICTAEVSQLARGYTSWCWVYRNPSDKLEPSDNEEISKGSRNSPCF